MRTIAETKSTLNVTPIKKGLVQRKCTFCEQDMPSPQARSQIPPIVNEVLHSPGQPLDPNTRNFMESRFVHDFTQVRVHTDAKAAESARALNALAYTVGKNIVFGTGQYTPQLIKGQRLLAHELTHVVQQSGGETISPALTAFEIEADRIGEAVVEGRNAPPITKHGGIGLARTPVTKNTAIMSDDELQAEHELIQDWLLNNPNHPDSSIISDYFAVMEQEITRRAAQPSSGPPPSLNELLNYTSPRGWHRSLPQSTLSRREFQLVRASGRRGTPRLGGRYPRRPLVEPLADADWNTARQALIDDIRSRLSSITVPTPSGVLGTYRGGYAYMARNYREGRLENVRSSSQHEFVESATLTDIGFDISNRRTAFLWEQFQRVITQEGDTSAINAWDNQIVTIGAGFSAKTGAAGDIYNQMPQTFRQRLYEHGICVNEDNSFTVLDLERGVVETGNNALRILQVNPQMLALLIQEAQSEVPIQHNGTTRTTRAWMLRAQFERFIQQNRDIPESVFGWDRAAIQFAFKLKHWSGALNWRQMAATGGDANALATYALRTIYRAAGGEWTLEYIRSRIVDIARRSGVNRSSIRFESIETTLQ